MALVNPAALLLLPFVGVLIWLYLRAPQQDMLEVPSLLLWQELPEEFEDATKLRPDALFWLQLATIVVLIVAFAGPRWATLPSGAPPAVIAVVDGSASMAAAGPGGTPMERAREELRSLASAGRELTILLAAERASVVQPMSGDRRTLAAAIDELVPRPTAASLLPALALAADLAEASGADIHVWTDPPGAASLREGPISIADLAEVRVFESKRCNAAITSVDLSRETFDDSASWDLTIGAQSFCDAPLHGVVTVRHRGRTIQQEGVTFEPNEMVSLAARVRGADDGVLAVQLDARDALGLDDRVVLPLPRIAEGTAFVDGTRRGEAIGIAISMVLRAAGLEVLRGSGEGAGRADAALQVAVGDRARARDGLPSLRIVPATSREPIEPVEWLGDHPAMRGVRPASFSPARIAAIPPPPAADVLLWGELGAERLPLAYTVEASDGAARSAVIAFDLHGLLRGDRTAEVTLVANIVAWLLDADGAPHPVGVLFASESDLRASVDNESFERDRRRTRLATTVSRIPAGGGGGEGPGRWLYLLAIALLVAEAARDRGGRGGGDA